MTPREWAEAVESELNHGDCDGVMDGRDHEENVCLIESVIVKAVAEEREECLKIAVERGGSTHSRMMG